MCADCGCLIEQRGSWALLSFSVATSQLDGLQALYSWHNWIEGLWPFVSQMDSIWFRNAFVNTQGHCCYPIVTIIVWISSSSSSSSCLFWIFCEILFTNNSKYLFLRFAILMFFWCSCKNDWTHLWLEYNRGRVVVFVWDFESHV